MVMVIYFLVVSVVMSYVTVRAMCEEENSIAAFSAILAAVNLLLAIICAA